MFELYLDYSETNSGGERENPEDRWSSRAPSYIEFFPKLILRNRALLSSWLCETFEVDEEVYNLDIVYMVVVRYSDGDTFGVTHGHWSVPGLFSEVKEAIRVKESIEKDKFKGYEPWKGYFARLEDVKIEIMKVQG